MPFRFSPLSITLAAGLAIIAPPAFADSKVSCALDTWFWEGGLGGGDFLISANWFDCGGLIPGPTTNLPIYFGPVAYLINGVPQPAFLPTGPAVLTSNFSSPIVRMSTGLDFTFSVIDATYTCPSGIIGSAPTFDFPNVGTATLVLDNAVWNGNLTIGLNGGRGRLILRNGGFVNGTIGFGTSSEGTVINETGTTVSSSITNASGNSSADWINDSGSWIELIGNSASFFRSFTGPATLLIEPGSTLRRTGSGTSTIGWDLVNDGAIVVDQGSLAVSGAFVSTGTVEIDAGSMRLSGPISGSTAVTVAEGARFDIAGKPDPVASFDLLGDIGFIQGGFSAGTLNLDGVYRIVSVSTSTLPAAEINHAGQAVLSTTLYSYNNNGENIWRNLDGASLELNGSAAQFALWSSNFPATLLIEPGSTLRRTGSGTSTIGWDLVNDGAIVVDQGSLAVSGAFVSTGTVEIDAGSMRLSGPISGSTAVTVAEGARFDIAGKPDPVASFDLLGDIGFIQGGFSAGTLNLDGVYRVVSIGGSHTLPAAEINHAGQAVLSTTLYSYNNNGENIWRNLDGASLELNGSAAQFALWSSNFPATLLIEPGSTLRRTGSGTSTIWWDLVNDGAIVVDQGSLTVSGGFVCAGELLVNGTMTVTRSNPQFKSANSRIGGSGTLRFTNAQAVFNQGIINPAPVDPAIDPDGLKIEVPFIQNDQTAVFRTQIGSLSGKLTCTGIYNIAGSIDIQRFGEFEPDGSESFTVISAPFVSGAFGYYFDNAVPISGDTAFAVRTGDLQYDVVYTATAVIIRNVSIVVPPCNPADLASPSGILDLNDITAFVAAFAAQNPIADLAEPFGTFDLGDINAFVTAFAAGCP